MGARYPAAEWVPWGYNPSNPSYYAGQNQPAAAVLHVASGWASTIRTWAAQGYAGASWHFTVCQNGAVLQHIELEDGGYHAGIARYRYDGSPNPEPTWSGWRGWGVNVNHYTIGIEHEGMSGVPFTPEQAAASRSLCEWIAATCGFPYDREHFPPHADIALLDRPHDFNTPALREEYYGFLFSSAPPAEPWQPMPGAKPIPFSWEQSRVLQDAVWRPAVVIPRRYIRTGVDFEVHPGYGMPPNADGAQGSGRLPAGTLMAEYSVYIAVNAEDLQPL